MSRVYIHHIPVEISVNAGCIRSLGDDVTTQGENSGTDEEVKGEVEVD